MLTAARQATGRHILDLHETSEIRARSCIAARDTVTSNKGFPSQAHFKPISPISAYFSERHVKKCVAKYVFLFSKSIILNPVTIGHSQSVENALAGIRYSLPHSTRTVLPQYPYSSPTVPRLPKYEVIRFLLQNTCFCSRNP